MTVCRLLDVSRLVSRAGLVLTGVDRVELAYLKQIAKTENAFGLARTALGYVLLDQSGLKALLDAIESDEWGAPDALSRFNRRLTPAARRGQSLVRRHAAARCRRRGLAGMLAKQLEPGFAYYNVGHSNLTARTLQAVGAGEGKASVLIHDTIPLDWPDMQRDGTVESFGRKLAAAGANAQRLIASTQTVKQDVGRHVANVPVVIVAPLGVEMPEVSAVLPMSKPETPYFLTVGTIEPRKNHALLLNVWENWPDAPPLLICGRRGWKNEDVFVRLDEGIAGVQEHSDVSDGQIAHLMAGAQALLFPSFAEGYGLPPVEALARGTQVVVADLPACREVLGDDAVYLDPHDRYAWENALKNIALAPRSGTKRTRVPPDWDTHFKLVFTDGW